MKFPSAAVSLSSWLILLLSTSLYPLRIILFICWLFRQFLSKVLKQFIDTNVLLSTNFIILKSKSSCVITCFIFWNLMVVQINFISNNDYANICSCFLIEFLYPLLTLLKGLSASNIKDYACANSILVIHLCKWTISLLTSCIPHLVFDNVITKIFIFG